MTSMQITRVLSCLPGRIYHARPDYRSVILLVCAVFKLYPLLHCYFEPPAQAGPSTLVLVNVVGEGR
jgi:hypothetical protein